MTYNQMTDLSFPLMVVTCSLVSSAHPLGGSWAFFQNDIM